jgi:hypothetical protein
MANEREQMRCISGPMIFATQPFGLGKPENKCSHLQRAAGCVKMCVVKL